MQKTCIVSHYLCPQKPKITLNEDKTRVIFA